jgi:Phage head-tail joining protein
MTNLIEFVLPILTPTGTGGKTENLNNVVYTCLAHITPATSTRGLQDQELQLLDGKNFETIYNPSFVPTKNHLIKYKGEYYSINGITEIQERGRVYRIFAFKQS